VEEHKQVPTLLVRPLLSQTKFSKIKLLQVKVKKT